MKMNERLILLLENYNLSMNETTRIVAMHFRLEINQIKSDSRDGKIVKARDFCIYFLHKYLSNKIALESTKHRLIALYLLRDRLTIRHHQIKISWLIKKDKEYKKEYNILINKLIQNDIF